MSAMLCRAEPYLNDLILAGNLVVEAANGVVSVGLLLFNLGDGHVDIVNVLLDCHDLLLQDLFVCSRILSSSFFGREGILSVLQFNFSRGDGSSGLGLLEIY